MSDPILPLMRWPEGIAQARIPANDNALRLEALSRPCLGVANDESSPVDGDVWLVGDTPAGAFATFDENDIALYHVNPETSVGGWHAWAPVEELPLIVANVRKIYVGGSTSEWVDDPSITGGGGGGTPGGSNTQVQFNNSGAFGGSANFTFDSGTNTLTITNITATGLLVTAASASGGAGFRLPHGTAPTTPTNGDVWTTTAGMYARINGSTVGPFGAGGSGTPAGSNTQIQYNASGSFGAEAEFAYDAGSNTMTVDNITTAGAVITAASTTARSGLRVPHGTAPTSPSNGDIWTDTSGLYAYINGATVGPFGTGGGGLTNWTDAVSTSAPNATVPVVSLTANNAATNVDAAIVPKGTGSFALRIADGTSTGGNKRGLNAVDLQMSRNGAAQVASGDDSFAAGARNTSSGPRSVALGWNNNVSGQDASAIGSSSTVNSNNSHAIGTSNSVTGASSIAIGNNNPVTGTNCLALGSNLTASGTYSYANGRYAITRGLTGFWSYASGRFSTTDGSAQMQLGVLARGTTDATLTVLSSDAGAPSSTNQFVLPNNSAYVMKATVVVRENATGDTAAYDVTFLVKRAGSAGTTAIVGTPTVTSVAADAGAATWAVSVTANTTLGCPSIEVTGEAAHTLRWVSHVYSCAQVVG